MRMRMFGGIYGREWRSLRYWGCSRINIQREATIGYIRQSNIGKYSVSKRKHLGQVTWLALGKHTERRWPTAALRVLLWAHTCTHEHTPMGQFIAGCCDYDAIRYSGYSVCESVLGGIALQ